MGKILKYFELQIQASPKWNWRDYIIFILDSIYSTILPFLSGMMLVEKRELIYLIFLILPIYLKFKVKHSEKKKKRVYIN